jgi:hypothetical protein
MVKFVKKFLDWGTERSIKGCEVGQIDGIELFDARSRGGCFKITIENSLLLIRQRDPRRYARVKRYISRIINLVTADGFTGRYDSSTRTVYLEFFEMPKRTDEERVAIYASVLVDRTTLHVLRRLRKRRMDCPENEIRRTRLYVAEHNRFLEKLVEADLLLFPTFKLFRMEFDEKHPPKTSGKKKNSLKMLFSVAWRAATERKIKKK